MSFHPTQVLSIRIEPDSVEQLRELAEQEKSTLAQFVRQTLMEKLNNDETPDTRYFEIHCELQKLRDELRETRKDIAVATEALLVDGGAVELELASRWVRANLKRE